MAMAKGPAAGKLFEYKRKGFEWLCIHQEIVQALVERFRAQGVSIGGVMDEKIALELCVLASDQEVKITGNIVEYWRHKNGIKKYTKKPKAEEPETPVVKLESVPADEHNLSSGVSFIIDPTAQAAWAKAGQSFIKNYEPKYQSAISHPAAKIIKGKIENEVRKAILAIATGGRFRDLYKLCELHPAVGTHILIEFGMEALKAFTVEDGGEHAITGIDNPDCSGTEKAV